MALPGAASRQAWSCFNALLPDGLSIQKTQRSTGQQLRCVFRLARCRPLPTCLLPAAPARLLTGRQCWRERLQKAAAMLRLLHHEAAAQHCAWRERSIWRRHPWTHNKARSQLVANSCAICSDGICRVWAAESCTPVDIHEIHEVEGRMLEGTAVAFKPRSAWCSTVQTVNHTHLIASMTTLGCDTRIK